MIALTVFRVAAYVRSHRVYQALLLLLLLVAIVYGSRAPKGAETSVLTDAVALAIPILAWSSEEPARHRARPAAGPVGDQRGRRLRGSWARACWRRLTACTGLAALTLGWGWCSG